MDVTVNGESHSFTQQLSVHELIQELAFASHQGIAIAINNEVVPKGNWTEHLLNADDNITIIRATQGG